MLKRMRAVFLLGLFMSILMISAYAQEPQGPIRKLGRGVANIFTSPLEITNGIGEVNDEHGFFAAISYGTVKGLWDFGKRLVVGVYEVVTFPVGFPDNYAPIIDDPEFLLGE